MVGKWSLAGLLEGIGFGDVVKLHLLEGLDAWPHTRRQWECHINCNALRLS